MTTLDIRQLAEHGGVNPIAPVTVPEAVKFEDGADLNTAIGSIATIETSPATATHAVGDYIVWNGQVYKVTAAIAVGETLSTSTNVGATSVGSELSAKPVLIGTSATNPTSWTNFNLSEPISNFKYLIIMLNRNTNQTLATVTIPLDRLGYNYESWVSMYITSNWRYTMKYKKVSDTQMAAIADERAGFDGLLYVYGVK